VDLTAKADDDSEFAGWNGANCTGSRDLTCTVTMSEPKSVTATFDPKPATRFTLTVTTTDGGSVDPACSGPRGCAYPAGTKARVTATPGSKNNTVTWTGCDEQTGTTCVVTMSQNRQVRAAFSFNEP
jgi:List-Bact-rpt repeat protein